MKWGIWRMISNEEDQTRDSKKMLGKAGVNVSINLKER